MDEKRSLQVKTSVFSAFGLARELYDSADLLFANGRYRDALQFLEPALHHQLRGLTLIDQDVIPGPDALLSMYQAKHSGGDALAFPALDFTRHVKELQSRVGETSNLEVTPSDRRQAKNLLRDLLKFIQKSSRNVRRALLGDAAKKRNRLLAKLIGGTFVAVVIAYALFWFFRVYGFGLKGEYFAGSNFGELLQTQVDKKFDFDFNSGSLPQGVPGSDFSARWSGYLNVGEDADYNFIVESDDGSRLYIDDQLLAESWKVQAFSPIVTRIRLEAGKHKIRLEYFNGTGGAQFRARWGKVGQPLKILSGNDVQP